MIALQNRLGFVKDWHNPRDPACPNNHSISADCTCKRPVRRKPYRVLRLRLRPEFVEGRMSTRMVLEVHPDGLLRLREHGRRTVYETNVGRVYHGCVWRKAMIATQEAKAKRKNRKKRRRR